MTKPMVALSEEEWIEKGLAYARSNGMADASRFLVSSAFTVCAHANAATKGNEIPESQRSPNYGPHKDMAYDFWYPESDEAFFKAIANLYKNAGPSLEKVLTP